MKDLDAADGKQYFKLTANIDMTGEFWIPFDFNGEFDGNGFTISNVTINQLETENVGFLSQLLTEGKLVNVQLTGVNVHGKDCVGGLVGRNKGHIDNSFVTGAVTGTGYMIGGLVGVNEIGTINNSHATVTVIGTKIIPTTPSSISMGNAQSRKTTFTFDPGAGSGIVIGGLVGVNYIGIVSNSNANEAVSGNETIGGLIGSNYDGNVINSNATGAVSGNYQIGGLIGNSSGNVTNSSATGNVTGTGTDTIAAIGGLIGFSSSNITNSYATGNVTGAAETIGGLVGIGGANITNSYASGNVTGTANFIGGLVGSGNPFVTNSYYDEVKTGQSDDIGKGKPRTTEQMQKGNADSTINGEEIYTGWDTSIWDFGNETDYPKFK